MKNILNVDRTFGKNSVYVIHSIYWELQGENTQNFDNPTSVFPNVQNYILNYEKLCEVQEIYTHILSSFLLLLDNLYTKFRHIFKNVSLKANLSAKMYRSLT